MLKGYSVPVINQVPMSYLYDYTGVIHIHSAYSFDGRTPMPDILEAARRNSLDFVMLTDHSNLRAREEGFEGWNGDTLLIVGQEIAPRFNHYIAFETNTPVIFPEDEQDINPQIYIDHVRAQGGIGFIAHPDHEGTNMFHVKHFPKRTS
jgi:Predicted metal-dependent phosphoesterases (PHP family)